MISSLPFLLLRRKGALDGPHWGQPMRFAVGSHVFHHEHGVGTVCAPTAHTHRKYTVVFFPHDPKKKPGSKGIKRRVLTATLEDIE